MRVGAWIFWGCFFVGCALILGLWSWPAYKHHQYTQSGQRAAELGAQLAFTENSYRARTGVFTADFSQLEPFLITPVPCELSASPFVCEGYIYTLEDPYWLLASQQSDPQVYIAFDLEHGFVDCSHAPQALLRTPVCSAFE